MVASREGDDLSHIDPLRMLSQEMSDGVEGDAARLLNRASMGPRRYRWKGYTLAAELESERETLFVARRQQGGLSPRLPPEDRTHGMKDVLGRPQPVGLGRLGLPGGAGAQGFAFRPKLRPCGAVDRVVHAASAEQSAVGCIHDRVPFPRGYVRLQNGHEWHGHLAAGIRRPSYVKSPIRL